MISGPARYYGHSEWYDQAFSVFHPPGEELALRDVQEFSGGGVVLPRNIGLVAEK